MIIDAQAAQAVMRPCFIIALDPPMVAIQSLTGGDFRMQVTQAGALVTSKGDDR